MTTKDYILSLKKGDLVNFTMSETPGVIGEYIFDEIRGEIAIFDPVKNEDYEQAIKLFKKIIGYTPSKEVTEIEVNIESGSYEVGRNIYQIILPENPAKKEEYISSLKEGDKVIIIVKGFKEGEQVESNFEVRRITDTTIICRVIDDEISFQTSSIFKILNGRVPTEEDMSMTISKDTLFRILDDGTEDKIYKLLIPA